MTFVFLQSWFWGWFWGLLGYIITHDMYTKEMELGRHFPSYRDYS